MERPLVQHRRLLRLRQVTDAVLTDDDKPQAHRQLINAVADLRVDVIGSACQDHDPLAVRSGIGQRLLALGPHLGCVIGIRGKPGIHRPGDLAPGDCHVVPVQRGVQCPPQRGLAVDIQVGVPEVRLLQVLHIALQQLRIIGDNGAVIMVYAGLFIHIIGQAGVEDFRNPCLQQRLDVPVHDLCRVARRV